MRALSCILSRMLKKEGAMSHDTLSHQPTPGPSVSRRVRTSSISWCGWIVTQSLPESRMSPFPGYSEGAMCPSCSHCFHTDSGKWSDHGVIYLPLSCHLCNFLKPAAHATLFRNMPVNCFGLCRGRGLTTAMNCAGETLI